MEGAAIGFWSFGASLILLIAFKSCIAYIPILEIFMDQDEFAVPTESDAAIARALLQALAPVGPLAPVGAPARLLLTVQEQEVPIPTAMVPALIEAARLISQGHAIDVLPADVEISAQDAADILKVSRPYLLNLVKKGLLPYRMVGAHHRIPMTAVIAYKRDQAPRRRSLEGLSAETQDLGH
jgi:excisionase family DNA binding protein